jgi:hypothetical protein
MRYAKLMFVGILVMAVAATGCDKSPNTSQEKDSGKKVEHVHGKGPNGGIVFDLGKFHAEFSIDHPKKECTLVILGDDETTPTPVMAKDLTVTTKETKTKEGKVVPPMTIKMLGKDEKDGKATKFVGTDPGLGNVADHEGSVTAVMDGKPSKGEFKEE